MKAIKLGVRSRLHGPSFPRPRRTVTAAASIGGLFKGIMGNTGGAASVPAPALTWTALEALAASSRARTGAPAADEPSYDPNDPFPSAQSRLRLFGHSEEDVRVTLYRDHHAWCPYCQSKGRCWRCPLNCTFCPLFSWQCLGLTPIQQGGL